MALLGFGVSFVDYSSGCCLIYLFNQFVHDFKFSASICRDAGVGKHDRHPSYYFFCGRTGGPKVPLFDKKVLLFISC